MKNKHYYVYITTNPKKTTLYIGVTNDLARRLIEHYANRGLRKTFAGRYYCYNLIYQETFESPKEAIQREKELKYWTRNKKNDLIESVNPKWDFYNESFCEEWPPNLIWGDYYKGLRRDIMEK